VKKEHKPAPEPKQLEPKDPNVERLNKYIANSGMCSRREADQYIQAGVITVNGTVCTTLGTKVNITTDEIRFNGQLIKGEEKVYLLMNKPKDYETTTSDPHAEKTVMDLIDSEQCPTRVYPVGRLDKDTTGVLLFTNDGELTEQLTHPSYNKKKIYEVVTDKDVTKNDFDSILKGVELEDGVMNADQLSYVDDKMDKLGIEIHSGANRVVRRMFEALGYNVKRLDRVYFAGLTKGKLRRGAWRPLTEKEISMLKSGNYQ
jgi:23S rRNA pseudouridine2605 synthase